ncbi:MAG TPA: hypothetical protein VKD69_08135 [Vicinamibacterales bacterium]|nr:hypothetical protein [Vicinamibacterales bacterium]
MRTGFALGLVVLALAPAAAQSPHNPRSASARSPRAGAELRRTADGRPDLQGTYDIASMTPLEREPGTPLVMTREEAARLERSRADRVHRASLPSDGNRTAPPAGGDGSPGAAGNVGGYNNFWVDNGTEYFSIDGQKRMSIIVDPPEGRLPKLLPQAQQRTARFARPTSDTSESDPGFEGPTAYDDPERRPLGERCLLGFGSTSGPPALPVLYNNFHQIVQTPNTMLILNEMVHDVRVIRMNAEHLPPAIRQWMGDSVGRWDGDTLVVDTTNFTDKTRFRGSSEQLHVVERFSRIDAHTLRYRFTVEDPQTWERPWSGEEAWPETDALMFEYACHEGNYALGDILRGARLRETERSKQ